METYIINQHTVNIHSKGDKQRQREVYTRAAVRFMKQIQEKGANNN